MYKYFLKPIFFLFNPETAHHLVTDLFRWMMKLPFAKDLTRAVFSLDHPKLEREVFGIRFPNPVGLAAGFDKDAKFFEEFGCLGFGFVEIGTITPKAQPGNPQPRMFRLPKDEALINRMGFNNGGAEEARKRLQDRSSNVIVGGNIGKNKATPNDEAIADYLTNYKLLHDVVDYFVVNVSSPNTPGLRELQDKDPLTKLLTVLMNEKAKINSAKPILLKIAPDLTDDQLDDIVELVMETGIAGVIATNTTIERAGLKTPDLRLKEIGNGGLSGRPVSSRSTEVIRYLNKKSEGAFPIIGVGGIHSAQDAIDKLEAGASLVQIYTGFIYEGPGLIKSINKEILRRP